MTTRSPKTKSRAVLSRRGFLHATALAGAAAAIGSRSARAAGGKVVVGTWGGDYQNLIQKNIAAPLLQPQGIEVIYDTGNDSPRKTKMMAEKMLPRGTMDISALNRAGSYEMYKAGTLLEIDTGKIPNYKHVLPKLATTWSVPHIFSGRIILYNPKFVTEKPTSYADLWNPKYAGRVGIIDIQYQTTVQSAAMISGGSFTNYEPGKAKLMELKKIGYKMMPTNEAMAQALKTEEIWMCIMWKARGVMWHERRRARRDRLAQGGRGDLHLGLLHSEERPQQGRRLRLPERDARFQAARRLHRGHGLQSHCRRRRARDRHGETRRLHRGGAEAAPGRG